MGNRVFWIGILLGALLALALIWNPGGPAPRRLDDAPTWSGSAATKQHVTAAGMDDARQNAARGGAVSWPPVSRGDACPPISNAPTGPPADRSDAPGDGQDQLDARPPGRDSAPSFDDWTRGGPTAPPPRTARSHEAHWDGNAPAAQPNEQPHVPPGQAAPTGIVNPW
jgi:hypothetical protein